MYLQSYIKISHNVKVEVRPFYEEEKSDPVARKHIYGYRVHIQNLSDRAMTLRKRHWVISEEEGGRFEVDGEGVIGQQPLIEPGLSHRYNSFCVLESFRGSMEGYYVMERDDGELLKVIIPRFLLCSHLLN